MGDLILLCLFFEWNWIRCKAVARTLPRRGSWGIEGTENNPRNFPYFIQFILGQPEGKKQIKNKNVTPSHATAVYIHTPSAFETLWRRNAETVTYILLHLLICYELFKQKKNLGWTFLPWMPPFDLKCVLSLSLVYFQLLEQISSKNADINWKQITSTIPTVHPIKIGFMQSRHLFSHQCACWLFSLNCL